MTATPDAAAITRRYPVGLIGLEVLRSILDQENLMGGVLAVRAVREGGLPAPLTPSRRQQHIDDARAWAEAEAEAGRDVSAADIAGAFAVLNGRAAPSAPVADIVPPVPSQS